jgi:isocitrate/isopropylmalate dehydrogenase
MLVIKMFQRCSKRRLETDFLSLEKDADKLAEQAENTSKLTLIAKSNALRRSAKTKREEVKKIDEEIVAFQNAT